MHLRNIQNYEKGGREFCMHADTHACPHASKVPVSGRSPVRLFHLRLVLPWFPLAPSIPVPHNDSMGPI